jgi:hypothetical protein
LFCNDKIDIVHGVEFAQVTKQIRGRFTKVLPLAQVSNRDKSIVDLERTPREQPDALIFFRHERLRILD